MTKEHKKKKFKGRKERGKIRKRKKREREREKKKEEREEKKEKNCLHQLIIIDEFQTIKIHQSIIPINECKRFGYKKSKSI